MDLCDPYSDGGGEKQGVVDIKDEIKVRKGRFVVEKEEMLDLWPLCFYNLVRGIMDHAIIS